MAFAQAYQVRVLDSSKYEATQRLQQDCTTLTSKIEQLNGLVKTYLEVLDRQAGLLHPHKQFDGIPMPAMLEFASCAG